jgi:hypothetical protein
MTGELPVHKYVFVDRQFIEEKIDKSKSRYMPAVWFGLVSVPGRVWGCTVMLECGAIYRNLPPHAISFEQDPEATEWSADLSQMWDCYCLDFTTIEYKFLKSQICEVVIKPDIRAKGWYLFSASHIGDGWTEEPSQNKEFLFIQLDCGRLTIQPTNRVLFRDKSFCEKNNDVPKLALQNSTYSCEWFE